MADTDIGDFLEVPERDRAEVDPEPWDNGMENIDAFRMVYMLPIGPDADLPDDEDDGPTNPVEGPVRIG